MLQQATSAPPDTAPPGVWLFAYGSLIYKIDFPFLERRRAHIHDWSRRFWQGSHDHRGTEEAPGRVVTLIPHMGAVCGGIAYRVSQEVFEYLDHREKNGYVRLSTLIRFDDGSSCAGLVYVAAACNPAFLGEATVDEIAAQIAQSEGPSGPNRDYLLLLAESLRELDYEDEHVFALEQHLQHLLQNASQHTAQNN